MTRFEASNPPHVAMIEAFRNVSGADVCHNPIEMTRAVEQSGRFQNSVYEQDSRQMTRETWKRARLSFDNAYAEFREADALVGRLYGSLHKMKRSYIRSFVFLLSALGLTCAFPKRYPATLGSRWRAGSKRGRVLWPICGPRWQLQLPKPGSCACCPVFRRPRQMPE
tara:strand:- start:683 stop:1183 length:501 start_codon:yes stop_codon:yes gene_type:complete